MTNGRSHPRLAFFQSRYPATTMPFQLAHREEHVRCLAQDFDVICINHDCDYAEVCDRLTPDLCVFETGLEISGAQRLRVTSVKHDASVPKIALLNSDGCSELRAGILSDVDHWGISTLFTISLVAADHLQGIADRLYVWPNFVDSSVFRDYSEAKTIPVLLTGSVSPRYPWRNAVNQRLIGRLPVLWTPHQGYSTSGIRGSMPIGERYARLLNASQIALACGSVSNELVRKHLEIPGSVTCLVAERSPSLEAAGFVDMINCVFADPANVAEKVSELLAKSDVRTSIAHAGFELVHSRHTMVARRQVFQWYSLGRQKQPTEIVVQRDPFGCLQLAHGPYEDLTPRIASGGAHLRHLAAGRQHLDQGQTAEARASFSQCLAVLSEFPEAKYGMAMAELQSGRPREALRWIIQPLKTSLVRYGAEDPDPAEWALLILVLLCMGKTRAAARRAGQFAQLRHVELDRARWAVGRVMASPEEWSPCPDPCDVGRVSIHKIPSRVGSVWSAWLASILTECGQASLARALAGDHGRSAKDHRGRSVLCAVPSRRRPTLTGLDHPDLVAEIVGRAAKRLSRLLGRGDGRKQGGSVRKMELRDALGRGLESHCLESLIVLGTVSSLERLGSWRDRSDFAGRLHRYAEVPVDASWVAPSRDLTIFAAPFEAVAVVGDCLNAPEFLSRVMTAVSKDPKLVMLCSVDCDVIDPFRLDSIGAHHWVRSSKLATVGGVVEMFERRRPQ